MNPDNIPFNALIVGATNCGKTSFLVKILTHEFLGAFDYIFLVCPTYIHNKTYDGFAENDGDFFVIIPEQDKINDFLKLISFAFEGTNTLIILDDCAASKDVKKKTNELVNLAFSARQGNQRLGLDPTAHEYRKGFQRKYCLFGFILFAFSERHENYL